MVISRSIHLLSTGCLLLISCCRFLNTPQKGGSAQEFQHYELCSHLRVLPNPASGAFKLNTWCPPCHGHHNAPAGFH
ncbi:unnamed protein product [Tetraodon nigroviridis]|uniref:Chromosome 15 SCAF14981, whole genome shotgun sequence n=1 Tax=Tetraodon nigroviridis TaxID=99883 RepID=Q4RWQ2_TETNG|nr:unnamed protein product [Tetraodon nigroviridis]